MLDVLRALIQPEQSQWEYVVSRIDGLPPSHRIEMLRLASRYHQLDPERLSELAALKRANAIWGRRQTEC